MPRLPRKTKPTQCRGCEIVPHLPREIKVDVTKCHACHAKCRGVTRDQAGPSAPPSAMSATPATQNIAWQAGHSWRWVARLGPLGRAALCVAGVALGDIHLGFTWQAWRNLTSTVVLRGRRGIHGARLGPLGRA